MEPQWAANETNKSRFVYFFSGVWRDGRASGLDEEVLEVRGGFQLTPSVMKVD